jgi:hypothetical protein
VNFVMFCINGRVAVIHRRLNPSIIDSITCVLILHESGIELHSFALDGIQTFKLFDNSDSDRS